MLLSICIPAFNQARELEQTLNALQLPTIQAAIDAGLIEVAVSNNSSTDGTYAMSLDESRKRITWFTQVSNLGFRGNVQFLAEQSKGKYIIFLGCGETLDETHLTCLLKILKSNRWVMGTVGLKYHNVETGIISGPSTNPLRSNLQKILPKPLYTEAISGNVFSRKLFLDAMAETNKTGDSWPHIEASLRICTAGSSRVFRLISPLVTIHGATDGWWTRADQWKLTIIHVQLLISTRSASMPAWVNLKYFNLITIGLYGAIRQSSRILGGPVMANASDLSEWFASNKIAQMTLLLLRVKGFLRVEPK